DRPAQDERQSESRGAYSMTISPQQGRDHRQGDQREQDEDTDVPLRVRKQAEGGAAVDHMGQAQEAGDHGHALVQNDALRDQPLPELVGQEDADRSQEVVLAHVSAPGHFPWFSFSISSSAATQRSHTVGYFMLSPTRVE